MRRVLGSLGIVMSNLRIFQRSKSTVKMSVIGVQYAWKRVDRMPGGVIVERTARPIDGGK